MVRRAIPLDPPVVRRSRRNRNEVPDQNAADEAEGAIRRSGRLRQAQLERQAAEAQGANPRAANNGRVVVRDGATAGQHRNRGARGGGVGRRAAREPIRIIPVDQRPAQGQGRPVDPRRQLPRVPRAGPPNYPILNVNVPAPPRPRIGPPIAPPVRNARAPNPLPIRAARRDGPLHPFFGVPLHPVRRGARDPDLDMLHHILFQHHGIRRHDLMLDSSDSGSDIGHDSDHDDIMDVENDRDGERGGGADNDGVVRIGGVELAGIEFNNEAAPRDVLRRRIWLADALAMAARGRDQPVVMNGNGDAPTADGNRKRKATSEGGEEEAIEAVVPFEHPLGDPDGPKLHDLPSHLLVNVFKNLVPMDRIRVEGVSTRWKRIARGSGWSDITSLGFHDFARDRDTVARTRAIRGVPVRGGRQGPFQITDGQVGQVLDRCGRFLHSVDLTALRGSITHVSVKHITQDCRGEKLTNLDLQGVSLNSKLLGTIGRNCPKLVNVKMRGCFRDNIDRGLSIFLSKVGELKSIDLSDNQGLIGDPSFSAMPKGCEEVKLNRNSRVSVHALRYLRDVCPSLSTLELDNINGEILTPRMLSTVFMNWESLRRLSLCNFLVDHDFPDMDTVGIVFRNMASLEELDLNYSNIVTDEMLSSVASDCPSIRSLKMDYMDVPLTTNSLSDLSRMKKLRHFSAKHLSNLNDAHLGAMAGNKKLEHLDLRACPHITNEGISSIFAHCRDLIYLNISGCNGINDGICEAIRVYAERREEEEGLSGRKLEIAVSDMRMNFTAQLPQHALVVYKTRGDGDDGGYRRRHQFRVVFPGARLPGFLFP